MKFYNRLLSVVYLTSLYIFTCEAKIFHPKNCQRAQLEKNIEVLYNKTDSFKRLFPKDNITSVQFLTKQLKEDFMAKKNCNLRNNLLSFYINTFLENSLIKEKAMKSQIIENLMVIQDLLLHCKKAHCDQKQTENKSFKELKIKTQKVRQIHGKKVLWKAISEMDILVEWIQEYIEEML